MTVETQRAAAAEAAVNEVRSGMLVGLGTGRTAAFAVRALAQRVKEGLRVECVATSTATERLGVSLGLRVIPFETVSRVDLTIDGADEIDPRFRAIKGGGGALLREKVVAAASDRMLIVVDGSKIVERLGAFPLPMEVLPFAEAWVMRALTELGAAPTRRVVEAGTPFRTDQQNFVVDAAFGFIDDAADLAARLASIPGIVEHGLFVGEVDEVFVGREDGVERRTKLR